MSQDLAIFEDEPAVGLDVAPDDVTAAVVHSAHPAPMPLMQILPADFQLPQLIKFVPDPAIKLALDEAVTYALSLDIQNGGPEALQRADLAVNAVSAALKAADAHFEEPATIANQLHKQITGVRSEWTKPGKEAKDALGRRMWAETQRLQAEAAEIRRREQEEANRLAREQAEAEAAAARKNAAPAAIVKQLEQKAATAVAPPVPIAVPTKMASTSVVTTWKARIKGTPAEADPNPDMAEITPEQRERVLELMGAVIAGAAPITVFSLNWSVLNGRAKSDKGTLAITGIEAFADGGVRSKGSRSRS